MRPIGSIIAFLLTCSSAILANYIPEIKRTIASEKTDNINYRLPDILIPSAYQVVIKSNINEFKFEGSSQIQITPRLETNSIVLHAWNLNISQKAVSVLEGSKAFEIEKQEFDNVRQFYIITLKEQLQRRKIYDVIFGYFSGDINNENFGYYRAAYKDENGFDKWIATTQFESTGARWVFPCFDEPHIKATFKFTLIRPTEYNSISNMPMESTIDGADGYDTDIYVNSPKMSTYLLAFAVTDFGRSNVLTGGFLTEQSVYARKDAVETGLTTLALEYGLDAMTQMETYTGIHYTFGKMDQLAIPNRYYIWGAMENWGLITYKEKYLLYDPAKSSTREKQNILTIIAHEYAHQWFGNLVSPLWWNYIWLNEGFATFFEMYIADKIDPSMLLMEQFVTSVCQYALEYDGVSTTRPMTFDAGSPEEIDNLFDIIAYDKSGSVIRMMNSFLTEDVMKRGLGKYLKALEYNVARPEQLWNYLQIAYEEANENKIMPNELPGSISDIMTTWETQRGYPLLMVTLIPQSGRIKFSQTRFIGENTVASSKELWSIPINIATTSNPDFLNTKATHWLTIRDDSTSPIEFYNPDDWIIVNKQQTGYYRVLYDTKNYEKIIVYLNSPNKEMIHPSNRAQLIDDSFVLAKSGLLNYEIALDMIKHLSTEMNYIPLSSFFKSLRILDKHIAYTEEYSLFKKYVISLLEYAYKILGTDPKLNEAHLDKFARADVIYWLCKYGHTSCLDIMNIKLTSWQIQEPDMQTPVYCSGVNIENEWIWLLYQYKLEKLDTRKERLINALGCIEDAGVLNGYIHSIITGVIELDHRDDSVAALRSIWNRGHVGAQILLDAIIDKFTELTVTFNSKEISTIFTGIAGYLTTGAHLTKLISFADNLNLDDTVVDPDVLKIIDDTIKIVEKNANWSNEMLPSIVSWLRANVDPIPTTTDEPQTTTDEPQTTTEEPQTTTEEPQTTDKPETTTTVEPETTTAGATYTMISLSVIVISLLMFNL